MPGPFPGMDPWLEHPHWWQGRHNALISHICDSLNQTMPASYAAFMEERRYVQDSESKIMPDIGIHVVREVRTPYGGGSALIDPPIVAKMRPIETREYYIIVLDKERDNSFVTMIELLSPGNKRRGSAGWRQYTDKQNEVLASSAHFIEIDLLRKGERLFYVNDGQLPSHATWQFGVALYRADRNHFAEEWVRTLREPLPTIPVPLSLGDDDISLDIQSVFDRFYDAGIYRQVDYRTDPIPPLDSEDAEWAYSLLMEKGLRS